DDQRMPAVIVADTQADARSVDDVAPGDLAPRAVDVLINDRRVLNHFPVADAEMEAPLGIERDVARAAEAECDARRIGARCDHEIVLELLSVAVVDRVDAGPDPGLPHAREVGNVARPRRG